MSEPNSPKAAAKNLLREMKGKADLGAKKSNHASRNVCEPNHQTTTAPKRVPVYQQHCSIRIPIPSDTLRVSLTACTTTTALPLPSVLFFLVCFCLQTSFGSPSPASAQP